MPTRSLNEFIFKTLLLADIKINGPNPWDIHVHDERFYTRVAQEGSLGLGESYMDGWWDVEQLDEFIYRVLKADLKKQLRPSLSYLFHIAKSFLINLQSKHRAFIVGERHYDVGNDLFQKMLDKRMTYSCGYWKNATNLDDAQEAKLDLICRKINLQPGMKVLDIGCGWGSFCKYAAEKYKAEVVGITVSQQQLELAKERCKGLPITLRYQDYRDISEPFDRIVSVGQMEHVGYKNYRDYMEICHRCLKDHDIFLLHTIGSARSVQSTDPWIEKYIFPNGMIPSAAQLSKAADNLFVMEDWHNFGIYYDYTLMAWYHNFVTHWDSLKHHYNERFFRMWSYYLLSCAGAFRARDLQLWQIVYSKKGIPGGYNSIR